MIVISGTRGSGKTTIATLLAAKHHSVVRVRALTTRPQRPSEDTSEYDFVTQAEYANIAKGDLLTDTTYAGAQYGIRRDAFDAVLESGRTPLLVVDPRSLQRVVDSILEGQIVLPGQDNDVLTVFLDNEDGVLDGRRGPREAGIPAHYDLNQRREDRGLQRIFQYVMSANDPDAVVRVIFRLWYLRNSGGVLPKGLISELISCNTLLEDASPENVMGASYDLRLGDEYYYAGKIHRLCEDEPLLMIEPYDYAIVTSRERAHFPLTIAGRFDLAVSLFTQGIILSNGPQVDPGFRGPLFCLLLNTSDKAVFLKREQHYATMEFSKLLSPTIQYSGKYFSKKLVQYLPSTVTQGAIKELKDEIDRVRGEARIARDLTMVVLTLFFALIAIWITIR